MSYLVAFNELSSDRSYGALGGCGPIPWSSIDRYADRYGIADLDEHERFGRMIRALDAAYLKWMGERKPKPGKSP